MSIETEQFTDQQELHDSITSSIEKLKLTADEKIEVVKVIKDLVKKGEEAILIGGSHAANANKPESDLDLIVLTTNPTVQMIAESGKRAFGMRERIGKLKELKDGKHPWIDLIMLAHEQVMQGTVTTAEAFLLKNAKVIHSKDPELAQTIQNKVADKATLRKGLLHDFANLTNRWLRRPA